MYIRTSSFVSFETTFYIACIQQGFVDPKCNKNPSYLDNYKRGTNTVYRKILGRANADYQNISKALVSHFIWGSDESNFQVLLQTFALHHLSLLVNTWIVLR